MQERRPGTNPTVETRAEALYKVNKNERYHQIIEVLKEEPMTAKEVAVVMMHKGLIPTSERNFTAPRLTEMMHMGIVEPIGKKVCKYTHKMVTAYRYIEEA